MSSKQATAKGVELERFLIPPIKMEFIQVTIIGDAPLVMNKFSAQAITDIERKHKEGDAGRIRKAKAPKDFTALFNSARHIATEGWDGFPCPMFRNGLIASCRTVGFVMTRAKLAVFVVPEGYSSEGTPLVRIRGVEAKEHHGVVHNDSGVIDIRSRPMYEAGWWADVTVKFDAGMMSREDVLNLTMRLGAQNGLGAGRHGSTNSAGCGWGSFRIASDKEAEALHKTDSAPRRKVKSA